MINKLLQELQQAEMQANTRRHFLNTCTTGLGFMALNSLLGCKEAESSKIIKNLGAKSNEDFSEPMAVKSSHFPAKAKRVIYIHMAGAPSQLELFDYKPELKKYNGVDCPAEFLEGKKFAFIQGIPKMLGPIYDFQQHGQSGAWVSELLPHIASISDDLTFVKSMFTDQFNHAPAQLFMHTGSPRLGRPSMGAWTVYGLGTENQNLPGFIVLASGGKSPDAGKSVWGSGFIPSVYQGVQCRTGGDPVLYVSDPEGVSRDTRKLTIDAITAINQQHYEEMHDPEILARIEQYEMAFKMQVSVPEVMDIKKEPQTMLDMYGADPNKGSFANNCLLARRLIEEGVRFVQLFHWGWDTHGTDADLSLDSGFKTRCRETDQPIAALINDLKQRGLLDETLIVWGGEFGRTPMQENRDGIVNPFKGRDHHVDAFTVFMAGGGLKKGYSHGETDPLGYYATKDKVHVHDLQATILHQLGLDHTKLTYQFQGRNFRLTDVYGNVIKKLIA